MPVEPEMTEAARREVEVLIPICGTCKSFNMIHSGIFGLGFPDLYLDDWNRLTNMVKRIENAHRERLHPAYAAHLKQVVKFRRQAALADIREAVSREPDRESDRESL